jgi:6-phosphogluconate dehydrogenase (decarboxylating)
VDPVLAALKALLQAGNVVIDGGNSCYHDDIREKSASGSSCPLHPLSTGVVCTPLL